MMVEMTLKLYGVRVETVQWVGVTGFGRFEWGGAEEGVWRTRTAYSSIQREGNLFSVEDFAFEFGFNCSKRCFLNDSTTDGSLSFELSLLSLSPFKSKSSLSM